MKKSNIIYEARVPVTHYQGDGRAEWVVKAIKSGRTYSVFGDEYAFCHIDNDLIDAIFESYEEDLIEMFYGFGDTGSITKNAEYTNAGSANTYLSGIKNKDTALQLAKWLEAVASNALSMIPTEKLDRSEILYKDVKIDAIDLVRNYSAEVKTQTIQ